MLHGFSRVRLPWSILFLSAGAAVIGTHLIAHHYSEHTATSVSLLSTMIIFGLMEGGKKHYGVAIGMGNIVGFLAYFMTHKPEIAHLFLGLWATKKGVEILRRKF